MATTSGIMGLDIIAMRKATEVMQPYKRNDCPIDGYYLETSKDGILHCKWCGWSDQNPINRSIGRD